MSWLADAATWIAFLAMAGTAIGTRRRLTKLGRELAAFRAALSDLDAALGIADSAVRALVEEGGSVASTLAGHIAEARALIADTPPVRRAA
jgi:hypothetical protein